MGSKTFNIAVHADNLLKEVNRLYERKLLTDITLYLGTGSILTAHKIVLSAHSGYFRDVFSQKTIDDKHVIANISLECGKSLLEFMYSGELKLNKSNVRLLLHSATQLEISSAVDVCKEYIKNVTEWSDPLHISEDVNAQPMVSAIKVEPQDSDVSEQAEGEDETADQECNTDETSFIKPSKKQIDTNTPTRRSKRLEIVKSTWGVRTISEKTKTSLKLKLSINKCQPENLSVTERCLGQPKKSQNVDVNLTFLEKRPKLERVYSCLKCPRKFAFKSLLVYHEKSHNVHKNYYALKTLSSIEFGATGIRNLMITHKKSTTVFSCKYCRHSYKFYSQFKYHFNKFHKKQYICSACKRVFLQKKCRDLHVIAMHDGMLRAITKSLDCQKCSRKFRHKNVYNKHLKGVHGAYMKQAKRKEEFKCDECGKNFKLKKNLREHLRLVHHVWNGRSFHQPVLWTCTKCEKNHATCKALKQHMSDKHPEIIFKCDYCPFTSCLEKIMNRHQSSKHTKKESMIICDMCGKQFAKRYFLKIHMYSKHNIKDPTVKIFNCPVEECDYYTFQTHTLKQHMRRHQTDKPYACEQCGKKLKTAVSLAKHVQKIHLQIRPYICDKCGISYGDVWELKAHMARHSSDKKYTCHQCEYSTQDKGNLQSHLYARHRVVMENTQRIHICQFCDFTTSRKTRFTEHVNAHKNVRPFSCPHCNKTFITNSTLKGHLQWIHSDKNYKCDYCEYVTSTLSHVREHMRVMHTHRDVKPYKCAYCDFRCAVSGNCRKHIRNRHKGMKIKWEKVCDKYDDKDMSTMNCSSGDLANVQSIEDFSDTDCNIKQVRLSHVSDPPVIIPIKTNNTQEELLLSKSRSFIAEAGSVVSVTELGRPTVNQSNVQEKVYLPVSLSQVVSGADIVHDSLQLTQGTNNSGIDAMASQTYSYAVGNEPIRVNSQLIQHFQDNKKMQVILIEGTENQYYNASALVETAGAVSQNIENLSRPLVIADSFPQKSSQSLS